MLFDPTLNPYVEKNKTQPRIQTSLENSLIPMREKYSIVDLGCGNGHFLQEYMDLNSHAVGLGVEKRYKRVFLTAKKMDQVSSPLSQVLQMDILEFLEECPLGFWDEVWYQFPDPWPKARHEKNRMVNARTFQLIYSILKPRGRLCFRSDCRAYWEFLQMANIRYELFSVVRSQIGDLFSDVPTTLYQRKFLQLSTPIYSLEFRK